VSTELSSPEPLLAMWTDLNSRFFRGSLPPIRIEWSRRLTSSAGMFVSRTGPRHPFTHLRHNHSRRRCIKLSALLLTRNRPQHNHETLTTLAHEMIHQWQYDILKRRPNHGADFRRMMARMNEQGLGITIYHSLGKEVAALAKYAWRCQHCGVIYQRQRRSIQPRRHSCGACRGPLRELAVVKEHKKPELELTPASSMPTNPGLQLILPFRVG
jgi:predicted SprT family Zn-dependent metalloprotease